MSTYFMDGLGIYRMSQVEEMTSVGAHTLRAWERRYGVPRPPRSDGRQRRYTQEDVQLVRRMRQLADGGHSLTNAADLALREMRERQAASGAERAYELLLERLAEYDERGASAIWLAASEGRTVADCLERIAVPLLIRTGELWEAGRLTIGAEHFISSFLRGRIELLYRSAPVALATPTVLLGCFPGERHELGLFMLAVLLRYDGVPTTFLGADVPTASLVETIGRLHPAVIVLYAASLESAANLPAAIEDIRWTSSAPVVYGGQAFDSGEPNEVPNGVYGGPSIVAGAALIAELYRRSARERNKS